MPEAHKYIIDFIGIVLGITKLQRRWRRKYYYKKYGHINISRSLSYRRIGNFDKVLWTSSLRPSIISGYRMGYQF